MIIKKRAQGTIEFIILFGVILVFFIAFFAIVQNNISEKNEDKEKILLQNIALDVRDEINLAAEASDGYSREFNVPEKVLGGDYEITISNNFVYASMEKIGFAYKAVEVNGLIKKGVNNVTKEEGIIYLNKEVEPSPPDECGNGICEPPEEDIDTCSADCGTLPTRTCPNGVCGPDENYETCPQDCVTPECGNGICEEGEDNINCEKDCFCGNGYCEPGEDAENCPVDCEPTPPEECDKKCLMECHDICMEECIDNYCGSNPKCDFYGLTEECEELCGDSKTIVEVGENSKECFYECTETCLKGG